MKEDIKNLWVEALRSGRYTQTKRRLKDNKGYCCLGVLCEISNLDKFTKIENSIENPYLYLGNIGMPHDEIREWAGLKPYNPKSNLLDKLTQLNDSEGYSFDQIADYIEVNWKDL